VAFVLTGRAPARREVAHPGIEVLDAGSFTTVQDDPGRLGYWMVGVPPGGAMDDLSFRLANRAVANLPSAAGLECTASGPTLRFDAATVVCLTGALMAATLDDRPVPFWQPFEAPSGSVLRLGRLLGAGLRTYVAVRGGIDVPAVLGSRGTFTLGAFGGLDGRTLAAGDRLPVGTLVSERVPSPVPVRVRPLLTTHWHLGVLEGPHGAPDFFTPDDIDELFAAVWRVQSHCARTGIRLDGPKPTWARPDGGDAGLHPSNIHDTGYAFGTVDFTGDTPVILGPDGPSLGGFCCPATVVTAERWKLGQLAPGDQVSLVPVPPERAASIGRRNADVVRRLRTAGHDPLLRSHRDAEGGVLAVEGGAAAAEPGAEAAPRVTYRRAGDAFLLVEYGEMVLDLGLRARVHALEARLAPRLGAELIDITPGVRSLLVHHDPAEIDTAEVLDIVRAAESGLPASDQLEVPGRIVHLPLSWEDPATLDAIRRYMDVVRDDAPWCPSNIEFIRRINGLDTVDDVRSTVFDARYLVLGLGDVYLGAPVATPLDPRHRLVTTKYNPARTWTPENAVGIGGAYLCIYGMEGPGGYQFVGRTIPVWYLDVPTPGVDPSSPDAETPWLLRTFDQLRFHPVGAEELLDQRARARAGELSVKTEATTFRLADHQRFLAENAGEIEAFRRTQQAAFGAERDAWRASGELT
jgi:urea carboxylase